MKNCDPMGVDLTLDFNNQLEKNVVRVQIMMLKRLTKDNSNMR